MPKDWYLYLDRNLCAMEVAAEKKDQSSLAQIRLLKRVEEHIKKQAEDLKAFGYEDGELVIRFSQVEVMPMSVTLNTPAWRHLQAERRAKRNVEVCSGD